MNNVRTAIRGEDGRIAHTVDGAMPLLLKLDEARAQSKAGHELIWLDQQLQAEPELDYCRAARVSIGKCLAAPTDALAGFSYVFQKIEDPPATRAFLIKTSADAKALGFSYADRVLQHWLSGVVSSMGARADLYPEFHVEPPPPTEAEKRAEKMRRERIRAHFEWEAAELKRMKAARR